MLVTLTGPDRHTEPRALAALVATLRAAGAEFDVPFDASSGKGLQPDTWPAPLAAPRCGYAGGLGPANVAGELPRIAAAAGDRDFWIDMASSLRDPGTGEFRVDACEQVLQAADRFAGSWLRRQDTPARVANAPAIAASLRDCPGRIKFWSDPVFTRAEWTRSTFTGR